MSTTRMLVRSLRIVPRVGRPLSTSSPCLNLKNRKNDTQEEYERIQKEKPLNPHMTNTTSTIANEMPSIGKDSVPPEMITQVDPNFVPKDSSPSNTARMTGDTQESPTSGTNAELDVGEIEGGSFRVEPLRRTGEDINTLRARLTYQSRKRGTLESDLLLSTFADANLETMTTEQLQAYDIFLDENDWDIYYWVTQEPPPTSQEYAEGGGPDMATPTAQGKDISSSTPSNSTPSPAEGDRRAREPAQGEWAQTVGTFKAAYRPVPKRWKNSEILAMLRRHVIVRSAGGIHLDNAPGLESKDLKTSPKGVGGGGIGRMPELRELKR